MQMRWREGPAALTVCLTVTAAGPSRQGVLELGRERPRVVYASFGLASPSGKMILFTKKKITMEMPPFRTVVPML